MFGIQENPKRKFLYIFTFITVDVAFMLSPCFYLFGKKSHSTFQPTSTDSTTNLETHRVAPQLIHPKCFGQGAYKTLQPSPSHSDLNASPPTSKPNRPRVAAAVGGWNGTTLFAFRRPSFGTIAKRSTLPRPAATIPPPFLSRSSC